MAPADKRYVVSESGHIPPMHDLMREVLIWLDNYNLRPVEWSPAEFVSE